MRILLVTVGIAVISLILWVGLKTLTNEYYHARKLQREEKLRLKQQSDSTKKE